MNYIKLRKEESGMKHGGEVFLFALLLLICSAGFSEAITYRMQASTGANLNGFTTNNAACSNSYTAQVITSMNTGASVCGGTTGGRVDMTAAVGTSMLLIISDATYASATTVTGVDVTGSLRDYQEATNPGTLAGITYQLGYVASGSGTFTSLGQVNEVRDWSTNTQYTTSLSSISGLAPANSRLAIRVLKAAATQYRYYFTATSVVLNVTESAGGTPGITVNPTSGLTTTEAGGTAQFTIVLDSAPTANVTIGLSSSDTTEGTVSPASVTFTTANWSSAQTVTVTGQDDAIVDGNIAYTIVTAAATSTDGNYNNMNASDVSVTNNDNDVATPGITVNPTSGLTTTEAGGQAQFTIVLDSAPTANVTIGLSSSITSEGTVSPASVTFTTANWSSAQTVTITGQNDAIVDGNIAYSIITAAATSTDGNYNNMNASDVSVTNIDNDGAAGVPAGNMVLFGLLVAGIAGYGVMRGRSKKIQG